MKANRLTWSCLALGLGLSIAMTAPASARAVIGVSIGVAPPVALVERIAVRPGYVWAPGYWRWNGMRHVWVGGVWLRARPGRHYEPAGWVSVGPAWRFHRGYWR